MNNWKRWFVVVTYAAAMAWVESAVVFYLRTMVGRIEPYQAHPLPMDGPLGITELVREESTLVMLLAAGSLAGRTWIKRLGYTAVAFGGTAAPYAASSATAARATRLLWQQTLAGSAVSGLAVHPSGDLIVTMDGGMADTVYALAPDQPKTQWGHTLGATLPPFGVTGTPAIGAGDAASARIYVASSIGDLYAINPDSGEAWRFVTNATNFAVGPAVMQLDGGVDQIMVPDGVGGGNSKLWRGTSGTDVTSVASDNRDFHAAPLILNGGVYFGTQTMAGTTSHLTKHSINPDGFDTLELLILQIGVMNHLGDFSDRLILDAEASNQCLERAAIAVMGELHVHHVEGKDSAIRRNCRRENKLRSRIDESSNQPR